MSQAPGPDVYVWENAGSTIGAQLAAGAGCAVVAVPQNIYTAERGFRDQWLGRRGLAALEKELEFLRGCDAVFCIAREEQWLLRVQGIPADHLPYYPPTALERFLLEVRERRRPSTERRFLLLGTFNYPPTARSFVELIEFLCSKAWSRDFIIDVAGQGSERLASTITAPHVVLHGTVTQERLGELLETTTAAIVHQRPSVGALTRIPELLVAGVPVIANVDASRSTWSFPGVSHYESLEELEEIVKGPLPASPPFQRPVQAEDRFCRAMMGLAASRR
jgi:hypothetical protein